VDLRKKKFEDVVRTEAPDAMVHMGFIRHFRGEERRRHDVNVRGTKQLLDHCANYGIQKLVVVSSGYVYGAFPENPFYMNEDYPLSASRSYPEIRDLVEVDTLASAFIWKYPQIRTSVLRPVNVLGHFVHSMIGQYLRRERVPTMMGFDPVMQFIHEDDLCEAIALSLEHDLRGVFNVTGSGQVPLHTAIKETGARAIPLPEPLFRPIFHRLFRLGFWPIRQARSTISVPRDSLGKALQGGDGLSSPLRSRGDLPEHSPLRPGEGRRMGNLQRGLCLVGERGASSARWSAGAPSPGCQVRRAHSGARCGWRLAVCLLIAFPACRGGQCPPSAPLPASSKRRPPLQSPDLVLWSRSRATPDLYSRIHPMPILAALARAGVAAEHVESVVPATAYPVHTTLVTGRPPNDHGIPADRMLGDHGVRRERYSHASYVRGATLWQSAIEARIGVAALDWPSTLGAAIPLLLPDVLPTRRGERWIDLLAEATTPWLLTLARSSPEVLAASGAPGAPRDALLVDLACHVVAAEPPPGLVLLRLSQTEPVLSARGPDSEQAREAFARVDADLGDLLGCLEEAGSLAGAAIAVAGDGAVRPVHTAVRANSVLAEAASHPQAFRRSSWSALVRAQRRLRVRLAREDRFAMAAKRSRRGEQAAHSDRSAQG
jgi:nucleoside-diphosphate-sugar epimerase